MNEELDVVVVGAGVSGLRCAMELQQSGLKVLVVEASDAVGGRIRTDEVDGYRLDRGFQVLLTAYEECQAILDYEALRLGTFEPGAYVWTGSKQSKLIDPWRRPEQLFKAAFSPVGSPLDKLRVGRLRARLAQTSVSEIYETQRPSTEAYLQSLGFSAPFIEAFFRPFYAGIFLEPELATSKSMFEFVFKMFGSGFAALPEGGMQALPEQLLSRLAPGTVRLNSSVRAMRPGTVELHGGERLQVREVVLATDMSTAASLSNGLLEDRGWNRTQCVYFSADVSPLAEPMIALNGSGQGSISNVAVPSDVSAGYAPDGKALVCVSTHAVKPVSALQKELRAWFGPEVDSWKELHQYEIPHSLPKQLPGDNAYGRADLWVENVGWVCGDYRFSSSIEGALQSGKAVGKKVAEHLAGQ